MKTTVQCLSRTGAAPGTQGCPRHEGAPLSEPPTNDMVQEGKVGGGEQLRQDPPKQQSYWQWSSELGPPSPRVPGTPCGGLR